MAGRPDSAAHTRAVRGSFPELAVALREILGLMLCAYLGSVKETRAVSKWAEGAREPSEVVQRAYNAAGGTAFEVRDPTRDPDLVANVLGTDEARIAEVADTSRGWLVFIGHADVKGASAGSEGLYLAPLPSGEWRIWIVH